ncbi:MAG: DMT family transporter [Chloroflexi bacterium]|nr:DMT family transporter [Chloroflexota bacterium]
MTPTVSLALAGTVLLWASLFVATRAALPYYGPDHLMLLRFLCASATLGAVAVVSRPRLPTLRDLPVLAASGLLGITLCNLGVTYGARTVTAGSASMLASLGPVFSAILAVAFLHERLRRWGWAGIGVSFAGVAVIALGEGGGVRLEPGAGLLALGALAQGVSFVVQKSAFGRYGPVALISYTIWIGTLPMLLFAPGLVETIAAAPLHATVSVVYLGVVAGAFAQCIWAYALSKIPASRAASFLYLIPGLAVVFGWAYLGEMPSWLSLLGGGLTLAGVVLVNTLGRDQPAASAVPAPNPSDEDRPTAARRASGLTARP